MAVNDKNILIVPNIGSTTADPKIVFSGADASTGAQNITLQVYPTNSGTLSFEGSAGQLFSITNSMSGTIYSVNDVSGIPSIEVLDTGLVKIAQYGGNVLLGNGTNNGTDKLQVTGSIRSTSSIVSGGNISAYSDERLKTNWKPMPNNFVENLSKVKVGIYERTDQNNDVQVGVSAQSLQKILPEAIMTSKDDMKTLSISYGNAALASAVEISKEIVSLKQIIQQQQLQIDKLLSLTASK